MVIDRFAYLAALVVYKSTLPALLVRKVLFWFRTAFADGNELEQVHKKSTCYGAFFVS